jgi:putative transcription factor
MVYDPNQQDWDQVQWSKRPNKKTAVASGGGEGDVETVKKHANMDAMRKLENSEETSHKRVSFDMKRKIQKARMDKKMTQKQLAQALQVKPQIVNEYETGKAIPDSNLINKMQRILGTKLR